MKARGITFRVAGISCAIREAMQENEVPKYQITSVDMKSAIAIIRKSILLFETMRKFVQKSVTPSNFPAPSPQANFTPLQDDDINEYIIIKGAEKIRGLYQKADDGIIYITQMKKFRLIPKLKGVDACIWVKVSGQTIYG